MEERDRLGSREERWVDAAVAVVVAVLNGVGAWVDDPGDTGLSGPLPAVVAAASGAVLLARRRRPIVVLAVVLALLTSASLAGHQMGTSPVSLLFAVHAIGRWAPGLRGLVGLATTWACFGLLALAGDRYFSQPVAVLAPLIYAVPFAVGRYAAQRAERSAAEAEDARLAERAALARELHDIVTHALTGIAVQAGTARHLARHDDTATATFGTIEATSRQALDDLRRMLDLLREDGDSDGAPTPGVADLTALVAAHQEVHGRVTLALDDQISVGPSRGLVVYRVVQEALTNVARHTDGAPCRVEVHAVDGGLRVKVVDAGPARELGAVRAGHGLAGMRERVAVFGGTVTAGPLPSGGFEVVAVIPGWP